MLAHFTNVAVLCHFRNRFLENLAATELEKMSALSKGRQEVLAEAVCNGSSRDEETSPEQHTDKASMDDFGSQEEGKCLHAWPRY